MAAAYAAVLSLMQTTNHLRIHPRPPISLQPQHLHLLTQNLTFLQDFFEHYSSEDDKDLEDRITDAAHEAEDLIESHVVDQIHARSTMHGKAISSTDLDLELERKILHLDLIKKQAMEKMGAPPPRHDHRNSSDSVASVRPAFRRQISTKAEFDEALVIQLLDELTGQRKNLEIISIVGMGGIGKTTLTRNIYQNPLIVQHFDFLAWVTVSQEFSATQILLQILGIEKKGNDLSDHELGEILHKKLCGRRYLIVMDDLWSIEAWYKIKLFLPEYNNGSRIMTTTRLSNLALELSGSDHVFQMKFLDDDKSWALLRQVVFGTVHCPNELENIGKKIARNCRGLPLSIAVIGGLLAKSEISREYWGYTLENLSSIINLDNEEHCLQILSTSYKELPMNLKPCFLYMGIFPEDDHITAWLLVKLWVAEGILRPVDDKSLEEVAKDYLKELVDRNLIIVDKLGWNGEVKRCRIHDLLLDLCKRVGKEESFVCVQRAGDVNIREDINMKRSICVYDSQEEAYSPQLLHALESASSTRSLLLAKYRRELFQSGNLRLLRIYLGWDDKDGDDEDEDEDGDDEAVTQLSCLEAIFQKANLRFLHLLIESDGITTFSFSWSVFWNLQIITLDVSLESDSLVMAPSEIWEMALLRNAFIVGFRLPDPPHEHNFVLENLQTPSSVVKRWLAELSCGYDQSSGLVEEEVLSDFCLHNLVHLQSLESLKLFNDIDITSCSSHSFHNLSFPHSLKKLARLGGGDDRDRFIAVSPAGACLGAKWTTIEGRFCNLKILKIMGCRDLEQRLERLYLQGLQRLHEIPSSVGDILTLKCIELGRNCSRSAIESARRIKEEQKNCGNEGLQLILDGTIFKPPTCTTLKCILEYLS